MVTVGGNVNLYSHYGEQYGSSLKTKNRVTIWFSNPTPEHISGKDKLSNSTLFTITRVRHDWATNTFHFSYIYSIVELLSHVLLLATPWPAALQVSLSMGFPRQEYLSGLLFPSPGDLPNLGIEPRSPVLARGFFTAEPPLLSHKKNNETLSFAATWMDLEITILSEVSRRQIPRDVTYM